MFRSIKPTFDCVGLSTSEMLGASINRDLARSSADVVLVAAVGSDQHRGVAMPIPGEAVFLEPSSILAFRHDLLAIRGFDERIEDPSALIADAARRLAQDGVRVRGRVPAAGSDPLPEPITSTVAAPPRSCKGVKRTLVDAEHTEVRRYLSSRTPGAFLEIGANDPILLSQTWHLAQKGWRGVLVEPIPELAARLRLERPDSRVVEGVCTRPTSPATVTLRIPQGTGHATVMDRFADKNDVLVRTLSVGTTTADDVIAQELGGKVDFISIDVEGHEADVLKGLTLQRWRPALVLVEDDMASMEPSRLLWSKGYRMLRRTQNNNWWIPKEAEYRMTAHERIRMLCKFLRMPFRGLGR